MPTRHFICVGDLRRLHVEGQRTRNVSRIMAEIVTWVCDRLHDIVGLSDSQVAEYLTELAKKSRSPQEFTRKLRSTGTIAVNDAVEAFAVELWNKVPHKQEQEKPARARERELLQQQAKYSSYKLLLDPVDEEPKEPAMKRKKEKSKGKIRSKKQKNIRTMKVSSWESDDEEDDEGAHAKQPEESSDSDEWERLVKSFSCSM